ncbi:uncharacterized protein LTR77_003489 [Saxophila tyrrhenica]|uniref:Heterokaryon incompatibility domain-containing protein n=1 Tax=Saxophila tyrrhenica TaxID=1690608 RepID=A0AAV9PGB1_9PEZI|nr:hypothetical protein LTR77_003489 [Saxophila tyrrhenica]
MANTLQRYKALITKANEHYERAEWELTENALRDAERLCKSKDFPDGPYCQLGIMIKLAEVTRRHGRYEEAVKASQEALNSDRIDKIMALSVLGELGVNYRHMDKIEEANATFQKQYDQAVNLTLELEANACRAAGNLGMTMYQLYMQQSDKGDKAKLHKSIYLLQDRVNRSKSIQKRLAPEDKLMGKLKMWESIGVSRLSLPYAADGQFEEAVKWGKLGMEMTKDNPDPTVRAMSRFFYGNALLASGDREGAKAQFNFTRSRGECTPAIALSKELSAEHRQHLQTMIKVRVDLTCYDEQGYSALDYAVYGNDKEAAKILRGGLSRQLDDPDEVERHYSLALLWKHSREVFHGHFRPIINLGKTETPQALRKEYEELLDDKTNDGIAKRQRFDRLRLVGLEDFEKHGELPHFGMHCSLSKTFREISAITNEKPFVVFFSYRWIGRDTDPKSTNPDDPNKTQYNRMILAINELLERHNEVQRENVYIWLDIACIDQEDLEAGRRERGINSLPMVVAQCDAMISLVDNRYLTRAWCAVEVLIMQTLRETSNQHEWWEHQLHDPDNDNLNGFLDRGRDQKLEPSRMDLTKEADRRHIEFLKRQSMLLGKTGGFLS